MILWRVKGTNCLNKVQPMADLMFDAAQESISYAATLQPQDRENRGKGTEMMEAPSDQEDRKLMKLVHSKHRHRLDLFNRIDGVAL